MISSDIQQILFAWGHILGDKKINRNCSFRLRPSFQILTPEILWPDEGRLRPAWSQLPGQVDSFRRGCTTVSNSLPRVSINQTCLPPTYPPTKPTFLIIIQLPQQTHSYSKRQFKQFEFWIRENPNPQKFEN